MNVIQDIMPYLLPGALVTIEISVGAWVVSAVLGLILALARDSRTPLLSLPTVGSTEIIRAVPQLVVLYIVAFFAAIGAWFAILFTGRYPRGIFDYVEGVIRWHNRVVGYALILVTDVYPPFRLGA